MKVMKVGLVGIVLLGMLVVSGCQMDLGLGSGKDYAFNDLSESHYKSVIETTSDEKAKSNSISDLRDAFYGYMCIGNLEKMDNTLDKIINRNTRLGILDIEKGEKAHKYFESKSRKQ